MNNLVVHLIAARVSLAKCEEEENFIENPELDATIEQSVSNIEFTLLQIVNRKEVFEKTSELIQILQDAGIDYTLLLYLQVSENVTKGKGFVAYLKGLCEQYKVPYKNQFFLDAVWAHFVRTGVQPITPTKYLVNRKKEDILQEYKTIRSRNDWGQHNAFFFQTFITVKGEGFRKLFFFITRTWQDGVVRMHEILSNGCFVHGTSMHEAHGAFEHAIEDEALTSLILDSEILASALQQPVPDTKRDILQFPSILSTEMVRRGLLNEEDVLQVVVKDKTRPRGGTVKVSFHFVLCICAEKGSHKQCIELCQSDYKEAITAGLVHLKAHGVLPQDRPLHSAWYAFDAKAAISNGFTTAFTLKDRSDPHSRKHSDQFICSGLTFKEELCGIPVQDLHGTHLTEHERLWLLQDQLYTTPKRYMLSYAAPFKADSKEKKGAAKPNPGPQRAVCTEHGPHGDRTSSSLHLPAWLVSALKTVSGREVDVYSSPSSLECKRSTLPKASQPHARLYQVPSTWCAGSMTRSEVHIHKSNCTVVAVDDTLGVVYMTCVTGAPGHKITEVGKDVKVVNMHSALVDGKVQPLTTVKGRCIHWVMVDEEDMCLLIQKVNEPQAKRNKTE